MASATAATPRFKIELEFVLALANPQYLQHLGVTMPHLFNPSETKKDSDNPDAACFARYLKYLLDYWRLPEYSQYLTHPAATIRNLELLQNEQFRRDITHPALVEKLVEGFAGFAPYQPQQDGVVVNATDRAEGPMNGTTAGVAGE
ncbi:Mediator of RNA polymerase II transcription subunit 31 [Exophiala xenobiotica]|uniref:Mediator of RNA polymerase II transcription subunit 31 n=1 Tax=Lithohypha guttulata TaxID=1690604 RepID=A0ABR0K674_9EURO|nr:Mediator of RNA polymerase II transcription subunit 31 [Lithohypha guttulata]KAK5315340.1 Mediator of RNA polymerase II transcription subunit 31 [Exophiala xenobiotica]